MALSFDSLDDLRTHIGDCHRCPLGDTRTTLVFGVGDPRADVLFIGEAPGRSEDLRGEPFVGAAGQLLDELLSSAGMRRQEVYIANILKCRPPGNRDPLAEEIDTCTPFLREQVRLIHPRVIVTLGNYATRFVLKMDTGITRLRGTVQKAGAFPVMPIFHPAAALYDRTKRDVLFEDFRQLRALLDTPAPSEPVQGSLFEGYSMAVLRMRTTAAAATIAAGRSLAAILRAGDVLLLAGDLGAGKTALAKGVAQGLDVEEPVTSPTFNILLVHRGRLTLNHFDLYRLETAGQLEDIDYWGTLESGGVSIVEWGDRFSEAAPVDCLTATISIEGDDERRIELAPTGPRSSELAQAWIAACRALPGVLAEDGESA